MACDACARAFAVLRESGSDINGTDIVTACRVVVGDLKGALSGVEFWKRSCLEEERQRLEAVAHVEHLRIELNRGGSR